MAEVKSLDSTLLDMYPRPGQPIKQWVVDFRREAAWVAATCPVVDSMVHLDNTGIDCRNSTPCTRWVYLSNHDCCDTCNDNAEFLKRNNPRIEQWLTERGARPPIEADRSKFSNQIQPDLDYQRNSITSRLLPRNKP